LGSYPPEILFFPSGSFSGYFDIKLLKSLPFLVPWILPAGEFTVYKKSRPDHACPDPAENLILFNHLPVQGT
jgi:hypothetical protein